MVSLFHLKFWCYYYFLLYFFQVLNNPSKNTSKLGFAPDVIHTAVVAIVETVVVAAAVVAAVVVVADAAVVDVVGKTFELCISELSNA